MRISKFIKENTDFFFSEKNDWREMKHVGKKKILRTHKPGRGLNQAFYRLIATNKPTQWGKKKMNDFQKRKNKMTDK